MLDAFQNGIEALKDLGVPETQDAEIVRAKILSAAAVGANVVGMLTAIEFDHDESLDCAEINNEGTDNDLAPELDTAEAVRSQMTPEDLLGIGLITAQASRAVAMTEFGRH